MSGRLAPPRMAARVLGWAARRLDSPEMADDAADLFAARAGRDGAPAARRWYRRQAAAALARVLLPSRGRRDVVGGGRAGWSAGLALDAKVGARMLARHPGLTVVAGVAMAFAVLVGSATFEVVDQVADPELPLPGADRLVGLRHQDRVANRPAGAVVADFRLWREELASVEELGAARTAVLNLSVGGGPGEPVDASVISPVAFRIAHLPPFLGRPLVEGDAAPGAPPVAVVGHHLWQTRFGGDPDAVGRSVLLGGQRTTVVGVMPEGYGFPRDDNLWVPLREADLDDPDAALLVFGRLADGATLAEARAELARLAAPTTDASPDRPARLLPEIMPYARSTYPFSLDLGFRAAFYHLNVYPLLFLLLVSANVALLMFARAASRERELVVRSALGASRARIVVQLFVEALVLGGAAAAVGLAATGPALERFYAALQESAGPFPLPFWIRPGLSASTAAYAAGLTLLGAAVAGVLPGLRSTRRDVQDGLRHAAAGSGAPRLGGVWSAVVVTQVAATVLFSGVAWAVVWNAARNATAEALFPAEEYLGVRVAMDDGATGPAADTASGSFQRAYTERLAELERRIAADPAVRGVALVRRLPVKARGTEWMEVDRGGSVAIEPGRRGHAVYTDAVADGFFDLLGARVLAGRTFDRRDAREDARVVVVNASFVDEVLGGRSAVGRRIRRPAPGGGDAEPGPWLEIVGVVEDLVANQVVTQGLETPPRARVYHPLDPTAANAHPLHLVVHAPGATTSLAPRLYAAAGDVAPELRVEAVERLDRAEPELLLLWRLYASVVLLVSGTALFLSLAGIYAVLSFTVARRTREIGVRVALGAGAPRVVAEIFRRPVTEVAAGVAAGAVLMAALAWWVMEGRVVTPGHALRLLALAAGVLAVCSLACVVPTARALRVEPAEALGTDG